MSKVKHTTRNEKAVTVKKLLILPAAFDKGHPLFIGYVSK